MSQWVRTQGAGLAWTSLVELKGRDQPDFLTLRVEVILGFHRLMV